MPFIPPALHEAKRQAESALSTLMLAHPDETKAISLYFGLVETALKPAPIPVEARQHGAEPLQAKLYSVQKMQPNNTALILMDCTLIKDQHTTIVLPNGMIQGDVIECEFDPEPNYYIVMLDNAYIYLEFGEPEPSMIE